MLVVDEAVDPQRAVEQLLACGQRDVGTTTVVGQAARAAEARRARQRRHDRVLVVVVVEIIVAVELDAFEILLQDEVDDARDRVRPVDRRGAAGQHVDPLEQRRRDDADVLAVLRAEALAVDQDQSALEPEAAQLDALATVGVVIGLLAVRCDLRQAVQHVLDVDRGLRADVLRGDRGDRGRRRHVRTLDARSGYDDRVVLRRVAIDGGGCGGGIRLDLGFGGRASGSLGGRHGLRGHILREGGGSGKHERSDERDPRNRMAEVHTYP